MADEITIVSTTDREADVRAAMGLPAAEVPPAAADVVPAGASDAAPPAPPAGTSEPAQAEDGEGGDAAPAPTSAQPPAAAAPPKKKSRAEQRIESLLHEIGRRDQRIADLEAKAQPPASPSAAAAASADAEPPAPVIPETRPNRYDFADDDEYQAALVRWTIAHEAAPVIEKVVKDQFSARDAQVVQQADQRAQREQIDAHQARIDAFKQEHADYDQLTLDPTLQITTVMAARIVRSEHGPAIAYYLAQHPAESARIAALDAGDQIAEIAQLGTRLEPASSVSGSGPVAKPVTRTPPPVEPVGASATVTQVALDSPEIPYEQYRQRRTQERTARGLRP